MAKRACYVKVGDLVRHRDDRETYGFVTYIDGDPSVPDYYYVEVVNDLDGEPMYFFDDDLEVLKLIKE